MRLEGHQDLVCDVCAWVPKGTNRPDLGMHTGAGSQYRSPWWFHGWYLAADELLSERKPCTA